MISLVYPFLVGCQKVVTNSQLPLVCATSEWPCLQGKAIVEMITTRGRLVLELDGDSSPLTAGSFLDLLKRNFYQDTLFHRVIRTPLPFVIQGGDPVSKDQTIEKSQLGRGNFIDPKTGQVRFIPLEIKLKTETFPRYGRAITNTRELLELQLLHVKGALAMARSQHLNSASSQFFIALRNLPELDGRYAVFGRVIEGMDVLRELKEGDRILRATRLK